jgi:hypothetical protein
MSDKINDAFIDRVRDCLPENVNISDEDIWEVAVQREERPEVIAEDLLEVYEWNEQDKEQNRWNEM